MKTLIIFLLIIFTSTLLYSQSSFVSDIGTTVDIGSGSDFCADVITINGTLTGSGTFCNAPVAVEVDTILVPNKFELSQNYPNPFNPTTTIGYSIPNVTLSGVEGYRVQLKVYDVLGNEIVTLVDEKKPTGSYEVEWNADALTSGIYFYRLNAGNFVETRKMILLK